MGPGRPPIYNPDLAHDILCRLADGESLNSICRQKGMPSRPTVYGWVFDDVDGFSAKYARARDMQAHALADDVLGVADDGTNDWMQRNDPNNPGWEANGEHVQRSRLRVDARKWAASKIMPKTYGDKIDHTIGGDLNLHRIISEKPLTEDEWASSHGATKPDAG